MQRALLLAAFLSGCAGPATQLRRANRALDAELQETRAQLRKERRKTHDLENEVAVLRSERGEPRASSAPSRKKHDVPDLPVEVLEPDAEEEEYVVEYDGEVVEYDPADFDLGSDGDDLEYAPSDDDVVAPKPKAKPKKSTAASGARKAYDAAVAKVKKDDHDGAIAALRQFLEDYPRDDLSDNAQYWLGEVYYDEKDYARAVVEFRATIDGYPKGNKVPDALLKLGYAFAMLGQKEKARAALQEVVDAYPGTQPARLAAAKLEETP